MHADVQRLVEESWSERTVWAASELVAAETRARTNRLVDDVDPMDEEFL